MSQPPRQVARVVEIPPANDNFSQSMSAMEAFHLSREVLEHPQRVRAAQATPAVRRAVRLTM